MLVINTRRCADHAARRFLGAIGIIIELFQRSFLQGQLTRIDAASPSSDPSLAYLHT